MIVILLKGITARRDSDLLTAFLAFYGEHKLIRGPLVDDHNPNEFFMLPADFETISNNDVSVFHLSLAGGYSTVFQATVDSIDVDTGKVKLNLELLISEVENFPRS